jgi:hypothetical protein
MAHVAGRVIRALPARHMAGRVVGALSARHMAGRVIRALPAAHVARGVIGALLGNGLTGRATDAGDGKGDDEESGDALSHDGVLSDR